MIDSKNGNTVRPRTGGRNVRNQSQRILQDVKDLGSIAAHDVTLGKQRLAARGRELLADGRQAISNYEDNAKQYIAEHPFKTLLVALGVGTLIGLVIRRRS